MNMRIAASDLKLDRLIVLYPGDKEYSLAKKVDVIPLAKFVNAKYKKPAADSRGNHPKITVDIDRGER